MEDDSSSSSCCSNSSLHDLEVGPIVGGHDDVAIMDGASTSISLEFRLSELVVVGGGGMMLAESSDVEEEIVLEA
jgi:hypothetical protein